MCEQKPYPVWFSCLRKSYRSSVNTALGYTIPAIKGVVYRCHERLTRGTQRQFLENMCSKEDLRSRIFGTSIVKFLACVPLLGFSNV